MTFDTKAEIEALVQAAGGSAALAKRMGFDKATGRQRINNWRASEKIPDMVVKAYGPLFKRIMRSVEDKQ